MSVLLENNTCLLELKTKNQSLESEICESENKLKKALNYQKQLLEKINNSKNIGEVSKNIVVVMTDNNLIHFLHYRN